MTDAYPSPAASYDRRTIIYHWLTVALVAAQWLGAHTIDWFPRGMWRTDAKSVHIVLGAALGVIIITRLIWRFTGGWKLAPADRGPLHLAAVTVHGLLYVLLLSTVALGLLNAWAQGDSLFGLAQLPKLTQNNDLRDQIEEIHGLAANLILAVAALHIAASLWHQFIRKDGLLGRMIPALVIREGEGR